ncbi:MAG: hypothetical protein GY863_25450, partial [bacterium]|nr:hypothetical protein [bacterium]
MNGISDRSHFFPDKTGSQFSSVFDSNVRLSVSIGSEKEAKIVKIARTFSGPGLLVSHDPEQTRYLAEILDDSNVKCSVFTADSSLEDNRKSLENISSRMVKIFAVDESSCTVLPDELKFRFIINEIIPDSLEELAVAMINNLDISSEAYHFLLYDVRDRYLKENKLKIKHAENYDDQR